MNQLMRNIRQLAVDIGPRGSATREERAAADFVTAKFTEYGLEAWRQPFQSVTTFSWTYLIYFLIPVLAILMALDRPWVGVGLSLLGALGFILELNSWPILSILLPKRESINAIGQVFAKAWQPVAKVVVMAHLDSSKAAFNFKPGIVENFRGSFILMVSAMILPCFLLAGYGLTNNFLFIVGTAVAAGYLVITSISLFHREYWNRYTHGANDNASGVGVLLGLAQEAGKGKYPNLELWFVGTGSEEAGTFGATAFLNQYGQKLKDALFINIDNVGAGKVHYMTGEGMFPTHKASPELIRLAQEVQGENPDLEVAQGVYTLMSTDILPVLIRGFKGMSLLATKDGKLPNWHWITDVYENVEEKTVQTCFLFVDKMLEKLSMGWKLEGSG